MPFPRACLVALASTIAIIPSGAQNATSQGPNLRIVVIAGEGSVNVIKQKTATAPVIEVRDRNNLPVPGAAVTFSIGGNSASFAGGAQTLTVTTNAAGRAAAAALNPTASGSFQIQVAASYQGQTAAATIAQSNIATAAAAGGGISGLTIGIVGAAVGGGAIVATQVVGKEGDGGSGPTTYSGPFSGQIVLTVVSVSGSGGGTNTCTSTRAITGTLKVEVEDQSGTLHGRFEAKADQPEISATCSTPSGAQQWNINGDVSSSASNLTFSATQDVSSVTATGRNPGSQALAFSGALSNGVITGTLSYDYSLAGQGDLGSSFTVKGSTTMPVTAR